MTTEAKKLSLYGAYKIEKDVAWVDVRGGARVKVRYENSNSVQEAGRILDKKYRSIIMTEGGLPADVQEKRDIEICATAILLDWEGVTDEEGNELAFTVENARKVLADLPDFRRDVVYAARVSENFRAAEQAKIQGN